LEYADGHVAGSAGVLKLLKLRRGSEEIDPPDEWRTAFVGERKLDDVIAALNAKDGAAPR
jgi:hypothetical protein